MPRLSNSLLRYAHSLDTFLPLLLRSCRDLESARNELRWLREKVMGRAQNRTQKSREQPWREQLRKMCLERSIGKPLQYILGDQPFGTLEILCEKGVLIPRPETEFITQHLSSLLIPSGTPRNLRILDLCAGTGCISLLIHSLLAPRMQKLQILGIDNSPKAICLARRNLKHNLASGHLLLRAKTEVSFLERSIFDSDDIPRLDKPWDLLVSNPPYISPEQFKRTTARSVRNHEPKSALVPSSYALTSNDAAVGDAFYPRILDMAGTVEAKILLVEVADLAQARRVGSMVLKDARWVGCEIWRDWPDAMNTKADVTMVDEKAVRVKGKGHGRAVLAWTARGGGLIGLE